MPIRKFIISATILFTALTGTQAQTTEKLSKWLENPCGELVEQTFAKKSLSKDEAQTAAAIIDSLWTDATKNRLSEEWRKQTLTNDTLRLACACRDFGKAPSDGRSLYISMHGGGECPKEINDEQWVNQIYLYEPQEGLYVAPRAPWNTSDLWHKKGLDIMLEKLIQACVVFENVNPDKVYLLGYSAGGDGVWRMAPRMADKWAAASMMAGHPGNTSQINLRNLPYMIWMGEHDAAYNRNILAKEKGAIMDSLSKNDPKGYIHETHIIEGKGHWMEQLDTAALSWMAKYRRNPYPEKIVWRQEEVLRNSFYWISVPEEELQHGKSVIIERKGNEIEIKQCDYTRLTIYLNDEMFDLNKKVIIHHNGKKLLKKKAKRNIRNLYNSINERNDRRYMFPAILEIEL